jgi:CRP/FNR family transcriptional regulator
MKGYKMMKTTTRHKRNEEEQELIKFLGNVALFERLTKMERRNLQQYIYIKQFKEGEYIFKQGHPAVVLYIVKEGELKLCVEKDGKEIELDKIEKYDFIGESAIFVEDRRPVSAITVKDSILLAISRKSVEGFAYRFPRAGVKILYKLGEILSRQVADQHRLVGETLSKYQEEQTADE